MYKMFFAIATVRQSFQFQIHRGQAQGCGTYRRDHCHVPSRGGHKLCDNFFMNLMRSLTDSQSLQLGLNLLIDCARLLGLAQLFLNHFSGPMAGSAMSFSTSDDQLSPVKEPWAYAFHEYSVWYGKPRGLIQSDQVVNIVEKWQMIFPWMSNLGLWPQIGLWGL